MNAASLECSYWPSDQPGSSINFGLDQPKQLFESMVMALEVGSSPKQQARPSKRSTRLSDQTPVPDIPRFVIEIGEIKVESHHHRLDGSLADHEVRHIGCHMVMDIESPIHERTSVVAGAPASRRGGRRSPQEKSDIWTAISTCLASWGVTNGGNVMEPISPKFDVAKLAARAEDWYQKGRECTPIQDLPELMRNTAINGNCRLHTPTDLFEEFKAKVAKSAGPRGKLVGIDMMVV
ncbi:hypothetical protein PG994_003527 [Apiospora phragmitis]|uniref:Uncharacterized protein n=1 Tax=Apiospora phragmitis TaxID=2905665 RepID=A0ABR1VYE0_9PEZI